jgi:hypothetical protein
MSENGAGYNGEAAFSGKRHLYPASTVAARASYTATTL